MERIMFGHTDGSPYVITARNLENAWDIAIRTIWTSGHRLTDQRGNKTREILNMVLHITGTINDYPNKCPCDARYGIDFALGLLNDEMAESKAKEFDYSYGERIRRDDALSNIIAILKHQPESRNCVLPVFRSYDTVSAWHRATDNGPVIEVPCVTQCMVMLRDNTLHMDLTMRSNDVLMAMPSDVYGYRELQKKIATEVGCNVGSYTHHAFSAHIIEENGLDFMTKYMR